MSWRSIVWRYTRTWLTARKRWLGRWSNSASSLRQRQIKNTANTYSSIKLTPIHIRRLTQWLGRRWIHCGKTLAWNLLWRDKANSTWWILHHSRSSIPLLDSTSLTSIAFSRRPCELLRRNTYQLRQMSSEREQRRPVFMKRDLPWANWVSSKSTLLMRVLETHWRIVQYVRCWRTKKRTEEVDPLLWKCHIDNFLCSSERVWPGFTWGEQSGKISCKNMENLRANNL